MSSIGAADLQPSTLSAATPPAPVLICLTYVPQPRAWMHYYLWRGAYFSSYIVSYLMTGPVRSRSGVWPMLVLIGLPPGSVQLAETGGLCSGLTRALQPLTDPIPILTEPAPDYEEHCSLLCGTRLWQQGTGGLHGVSTKIPDSSLLVQLVSFNWYSVSKEGKEKWRSICKWTRYRWCTYTNQELTKQIPVLKLKLCSDKPNRLRSPFVFCCPSCVTEWQNVCENISKSHQEQLPERKQYRWVYLLFVRFLTECLFATRTFRW